MSHQITSKIAAVVVAVMMNGLILSGVSALFSAAAPKQTQTAQTGAAAGTRGIA